jgi:tricorn protease
MNRLTLALFFSLLFALYSSLLSQNDARLLRFPTIHGNQIVFTYAGDLYTVVSTGGVARKLTNDVGFEMFARFSPDGKQLAFTGQYDGNTEVYLMPAEGGIPKRLTFTATLDRDDVSDRMGPNNIVMGWQDTEHIVFRSRRIEWNDFKGQLYLSHLSQRRDARRTSPSARRILLLLAGWQETRLQSRLSRIPHMETVSRRPGG